MELQMSAKGANATIARYAAAQGMVLLENNNNALPLTNKKIALFGGGAHATVKGGVGSGNVTAPYVVSIYQGFLNAGYTVTSSAWMEAYIAEYNRVQEEDTTLDEIAKMWSGKHIPVPDPLLTKQDATTAAEAETAIYVITRQAGEDDDRRAVKGDYYLTDHEAANLELLGASFSKVVVVLNTSIIDTKFFHEIDGLDAMLLMSLAGMEGGNALVDVLSGAIAPSGKLTDTWALQYEDYPASKTFGLNGGNPKQQNYEEGIYVGYRYFDSFNIAPAYEFGYGKSYTRFSVETADVRTEAEQVVVQVAVTNRGSVYSGKEVVQIYGSAPKGELDKPYQELLGFGKTDELKPGESQVLTISFPIAEMASYNEKRAAWVLETGDYLIRVGTSSRSTRVAAILRLDETKIVEQLSNRFPLDQDFQDRSSAGVVPYSYALEAADIAAAPVIALRADSIPTLDRASRIDTSVVKSYVTKNSTYRSKFTPGSRFALEPYEEQIEIVPVHSNAKLYDVYSGAIPMEHFVAQLDLETLTTLLNGRFSESDYKLQVEEPIEKAVVTPGAATGSTTPNFVHSLGIPNNHLPDGPAGLHLPVNEYGCTAYPVGTLLAQTWDMDLLAEIGKSFGKELLDNHMTVLLGPGMNIHRDPLCGRNFEYFSEDPRLTGLAGAMITLGVQSHPGVGVAVKHFAANNQETERSGGNSSASERTLREIYLKGFEIAVKSAQPMTVMSSYNKINGIHTSSHVDLITHVLRGEWGFQGFVMTDWFTRSDNGHDMHAGNDIIMGGWHISKLINAVTAPEPTFNPDGSVDATTISKFGGRKIERFENWNAFLPDAEGKDRCCTVVAADVEVSDHVKELAKTGVADVTVREDGTKVVTYKGTYKDAYVALGDLQKAAKNLLQVFLKCWTVRNVYNEGTGYEEIPVSAYSSLFGDLQSYLQVQK